MIGNEIYIQKYPPAGRYRGSVVLVAAVLAAIVSSGVAFSLAKLHTATMKTLETSKVNIEAQQYGLAKAEYLRSTAYDALISQGKQNIVSSDGFKDEVIVGSEEAYNDKLNQKVCTINVYKDDEKLPRFSYKVSKLSSSSDSSSVPKGTILPWYGSSHSVPKGYALCDGQNGTPDLRGRFLVGVDGSTYKLGSKGGEEKHKLIGAELPSQASDFVGWYLGGIYYGHKGSNKHSVPIFCDAGDCSAVNIYNYAGKPEYITTGPRPSLKTTSAFCIEESPGSDNTTQRMFFYPFSSGLKLGNDQPHENRPPYFAVQYIMKL